MKSYGLWKLQGSPELTWEGRVLESAPNPQWVSKLIVVVMIFFDTQYWYNHEYQKIKRKPIIIYIVMILKF